MTARARLHHAGTCFWIEAVPGSNENLVTASAKIGPLIILEKLGFLELEILGMQIGRNKMRQLESHGPKHGPFQNVAAR
jgi:hypothetical protein